MGVVAMDFMLIKLKDVLVHKKNLILRKLGKSLDASLV